MENLKPGEELDKEVAQKIMGIGIMASHGHPNMLIPNYSTEKEDADRVIVEMKSRGFTYVPGVSQTLREGKTYFALFYRDDNTAPNSYGETPEHAMCLAALAALNRNA
jgi:hypothetical protein